MNINQVLKYEQIQFKSMPVGLLPKGGEKVERNRKGYQKNEDGHVHVLDSLISVTLPHCKHTVRKAEMEIRKSTLT